MRGFRTFSILVALVLGSLAVPTAWAAPATTSVLVTLAPGAGPPSAEAARAAREHGAKVTFVYEHALRGFAAEVPTARVEALARSRSVLRVEEDGPVTVATEQVQDPATWGLDRIDQRQLPLADGYSYARSGAGVKAYILDTGIRADHPDFEGRVVGGYVDPTFSTSGTDDCHGHGTHVAGTVGSATWGVAKGVTLVPVRVLDCNGSGSWSGVAAGLDWIVGQHGAGTVPAVANLSLSGGANSTVDDAVRRAVTAGITVSVAAGNGNAMGRAVNACNVSPARVAEALTVSAANRNDTKPSWANIGSCVDLFAPGVGIESTDANGSWSTKSGTSMAAPHVAGVAALLLSDAWLRPADVASLVVGEATPGVVSSAGAGSPNRLLYSRIGVNEIARTAPPAANQPPTATFTSSCDGLVCTFTDSSTDPDGSLVAWSWSFGDGGTSADQHPTHTYGSGGGFTVTLTVTDDGGATGQTSQQVAVTSDGGGETPPDTEALTVTWTTGAKLRGLTPVTLTWTDEDGSSWTVARDGGTLGTVTTAGFEDQLRGGGSATYRVCRAGTAVCGEAVVTY
jgi:subtilisin family serine protease